MKILSIISMICFLIISIQEDLTYILADMQDNWSIGNGCGQFDNQCYKECFSDAMELNGNNLEVMWVQLTINQPITNNDIEQDVTQLLVSEQIVLKCPVSEAYQNESTIIVLNETLSNSDNKLNSFKIYPNPATDYFVVEGENISKIECFNILGRKIFSIKKTSVLNKIYPLNYSSGMYLLKITDESGEVINRKLIIQ